MGDALRGIDHIIVAVRDLEAAAATYRKLGFSTTPRGRHQGWSTANHCVMFEHDYLELLGRAGEGGGEVRHELDSFLAERGEGAMAIALATDDAKATHAAWTAAGLAPEPVSLLGRILEGDSGPVDLRFENVLLDPAATAGLPTFACAHLTPDLVRRPEWLSHPNGAQGIGGVTVVAPDVEAVATPLGQIFGAARLTETDDVIAVHTGSGVIMVASPENVGRLHPELDEIADVEEITKARIDAVCVTVADIDLCADLLAASDVSHRREGRSSIFVRPEEAAGVLLEFRGP